MARANDCGDRHSLILIATLALVDSSRALRVASVEAYPVPVDRAVRLGVQLRNFGLRYARDVRWKAWIRGPNGEIRFTQSIRSPILATGDRREVLIGWDTTARKELTLQALADGGGTLISQWSWYDGCP